MNFFTFPIIVCKILDATNKSDSDYRKFANPDCFVPLAKFSIRGEGYFLVDEK